MIKKRWSKSLSLFVPSQKLKLELEEEDFEKLWVAKYLFLILTCIILIKEKKCRIPQDDLQITFENVIYL